MNFDFGDVITRAARITWKNKVLWLFSALPVLLSILIFPIFFLPLIVLGDGGVNEPAIFEEPLYLVIFFGLSLLISLLSFILYAVSSSSVTVGALRADTNGDVLPLTIGELFTDGRKYWWRILGVVLLVTLGVGAVFMVFFACIALFGTLTLGFGLICLQPLFILMYPFMMVLYGYMEEAQAAVVVDDLGVTAALTRAWELLKANFWIITLITFLVYLIIGFLSALAVFPFMIPFFFFPVFMENQQAAPDFRTMLLIVGGMNCILLPIMAVVQGVTITFMKATFMLVYLRLTRKPGDPQPKPDDNRPLEPSGNQTLISAAQSENIQTPIPDEPQDNNRTVIAKKPDA